MESANKNTHKNYSGEEGVDLGVLFNKASELVSKLYAWFRKTVLMIINFLLQILFFLRRNLVWLIVGTLVGLALGIFLSVKQGNRFISEMAVKSNFNSSRAMYGALDQLNSLIQGRRTNDLAKTLNISPAEAASLISFEATPEKNEIMLADAYKRQILQPDGNSKSLEQIIPFEDFKTSLTKFDYPAYKISVVSSDATLSSNVEQGIINLISSNKLSQRIKNNQAETNKQTEETLRKSIQSLDTLRVAYSRRIATDTRGTVAVDSNLIKLSESQLFRNPELELYHIMLELNNELKALKYRDAMETDIIEVYSSFSAFGKRENFLRENITRYSIMGLGISLFILLCVTFFKWLKETEKMHLVSRKSTIGRATI